MSGLDMSNKNWEDYHYLRDESIKNEIKRILDEVKNNNLRDINKVDKNNETLLFLFINYNILFDICNDFGNNNENFLLLINKGIDLNIKTNKNLSNINLGTILDNLIYYIDFAIKEEDELEEKHYVSLFDNILTYIKYVYNFGNNYEILSDDILIRNKNIINDLNKIVSSEYFDKLKESEFLETRNLAERIKDITNNFIVQEYGAVINTLDPKISNKIKDIANKIGVSDYSKNEYKEYDFVWNNKGDESLIPQRIPNKWINKILNYDDDVFLNSFDFTKTSLFQYFYFLKFKSAPLNESEQQVLNLLENESPYDLDYLVNKIQYINNGIGGVIPSVLESSRIYFEKKPIIESSTNEFENNENFKIFTKIIEKIENRKEFYKKSFKGIKKELEYIITSEKFGRFPINIRNKITDILNYLNRNNIFKVVGTGDEAKLERFSIEEDDEDEEEESLESGEIRETNDIYSDYDDDDILTQETEIAQERGEDTDESMVEYPRLGVNINKTISVFDPIMQEDVSINIADHIKRVDINKTVSFFDTIMQEDDEINIADYINEDKNNIVIVYDNNKYYFSNRETINQNKNNATVYPCKTSSTAIIPRRENVYMNKPLYDLKKIGFLAGYFCDMKEYNNYPKLQTFALINTNESYPSFVSKRILNDGSGADVESALHCQEGQDSKISKLVYAYPSIQDNTTQSGGKQRKKRENKKTRKNIKTHKTQRRKIKILNKKSKKDKRNMMKKKKQNKTKKNNMLRKQRRRIKNKYNK